jgi:hypothetical protein
MPETLRGPGGLPRANSSRVASADRVMYESRLLTVTHVT